METDDSMKLRSEHVCRVWVRDFTGYCKECDQRKLEHKYWRNQKTGELFSGDRRINNGIRGK